MKQPLSHSWSRRAVLSAIGASLLSPVRAAEDPLVATAKRSGIAFGASIARDVFADNAYAALYRHEAHIVTSDVALKFDYLRPDAATFNFDEADRLLAFARESGMAFRGHTLVWNENAPAWLKALSPRAIADEMDRHIDTVCRRYAGRMHSWDVVNEPFWPDHHAARGLRRGPWLDAMGPGYIARALRRAGAADPAAKLVINEAAAERSDALGLTIRAGLLRLIDELQHQGVPLHAIGLESHLQPQFPSDDAAFAAFVDAIASRGLDVYISELDIDDSSYPDDIARRDAMAADRVYRFLTHMLRVKRVTIVQCWQLSDRYSWYADPDLMRRMGARRAARPLPFDAAMNRKPMADAIQRAFSERRLA